MVTARQVFLHQIPVRYVKGVGPARAEQLLRLDVESVEDLLLLIPRRYEDRTQFVSIEQLAPGQLATLRARVLTKRLRPMRGRRSLVEARLEDETGTVTCRWFNQPYLAKLLEIGDELILHGRVDPQPPVQLINPETERVEQDGAEAMLHTGRIVPVYPLTAGLSERWFRRTLRGVLSEYAMAAPDVLPLAFRQRHDLAPLGWALQQIHFPDDWASLERARRRLAFEELFVMQVRLALRRARLTGRAKPQRYATDGPMLRALIKRLPFTLTASQRQVLRELVDELGRPNPMLRLLQGDVGCGKTVLAAALMAIVVQSGYQIALMAPTELLAQQHLRVLGEWLTPLGVRLALLAQGVKGAERTALLADLAKGRIDILIGTHAMLQESAQFGRLALVVIDEQHKFGVSQRSGLAKKAEAPDVLVMSATPIPRTMALSLYGDLTCSTVTELPPGRQPVKTIWYHEAQRSDAYRIMAEHLRRGRQGYVVYPLVNAQDRSDLKAATQMVRALREAFHGVRIELLHGQMASSQQEAVMHAFARGDAHLLVSTVIIEVGLDVRNATVMLIEHPERFGLAQLHQLRGRIGRGTEEAYCLIVSDAEEESATQRLSAFVGTTDGFTLAEADLALRGPGELLGSRQHGWMRLRVASLVRDQALLEQVRREAFEVVARDSQLLAPEWQLLKARLRLSAKPATPASAR